jgi:hypothetical protein
MATATTTPNATPDQLSPLQPIRNDAARATTTTSQGRWGRPVDQRAGPPADREGEPDQAGGHHGHGGELGRRGEEPAGILLQVAEDEHRAEEVQDAGECQAGPTQPRCRPAAGHGWRSS